MNNKYLINLLNKIIFYANKKKTKFLKGINKLTHRILNSIDLPREREASFHMHSSAMENMLTTTPCNLVFFFLLNNIQLVDVESTF